jgi:hypothetical protein
MAECDVMLPRIAPSLHFSTYWHRTFTLYYFPPFVASPQDFCIRKQDELDDDVNQVEIKFYTNLFLLSVKLKSIIDSLLRFISNFD